MLNILLNMVVEYSIEYYYSMGKPFEFCAITLCIPSEESCVFLVPFFVFTFFSLATIPRELGASTSMMWDDEGVSPA